MNRYCRPYLFVPHGHKFRLSPPGRAQLGFMKYFLLLQAFFILICPGGVQGELAYGDFWWDAGEADPANATYAPPMEHEITRNYVIKIIPAMPGNGFVADEPIKIRYRVIAPFDVRFGEPEEDDFSTSFEIISLRWGLSRSIPAERDLVEKDLYFILRFAEHNPVGSYTVPSFTIPYEYDLVETDKRVTRKGKVATPPVALEKVPVRIRLPQQRFSGFVWDIFPVVYEIVADKIVMVLDEASSQSPGKKQTGLDNFDPGFPFILLGKNRSVVLAENYRIIRWQYDVGLKTINGAPFSLRLPPLGWRRHGEQSPQPNPIPPDNNDEVQTLHFPPILFDIKQITGEKDSFRPLKTTQTSLSDIELKLFNIYPQRLLAGVLTVYVLWLLYLVRTSSGLRKSTTVAPFFIRPFISDYDKWPWQRAILACRLFLARQRYNRGPTRENCIRYRNLLARWAVARFGKKEKVTIVEAGALTAMELQKLGALKAHVADLSKLELQMEIHKNRQHIDSKEGGNEV